MSDLTMDAMDAEVAEKMAGGSSTSTAPVPPKAPRAPAGNVDFEAPWIEKYRPQELRDVQGNVEIVSRLESIARDGSMPNIIIAGPPGTGKTTSLLALARTLLGDCFKDAVHSFVVAEIENDGFVQVVEQAHAAGIAYLDAATHSCQRNFLRLACDELTARTFRVDLAVITNFICHLAALYGMAQVRRHDGKRIGRQR